MHNFIQHVCWPSCDHTSKERPTHIVEEHDEADDDLPMSHTELCCKLRTTHIKHSVNRPVADKTR